MPEARRVTSKPPKQGSGDSVSTAMGVPRQSYLASALVDQKTHEIPVARERFGELDLPGRRVCLDAWPPRPQPPGNWFWSTPPATP